MNSLRGFLGEVSNFLCCRTVSASLPEYHLVRHVGRLSHRRAWRQREKKRRGKFHLKSYLLLSSWPCLTIMWPASHLSSLFSRICTSSWCHSVKAKLFLGLKKEESSAWTVYVCVAVGKMSKCLFSEAILLSHHSPHPLKWVCSVTQ